MDTSGLQMLIGIFVLVVVIAVTVRFWNLFYRMMGDVHRIAEALAPEAKKSPRIGEDILSKRFEAEFRDDGRTKKHA